MKRLLIFIAAAALLSGCSSEKTLKDEVNYRIDKKNLMATVNYLASPELNGRLAGSEGYNKAARFMENEFKALKLKPAFDGGYMQEFPIEYNDITGTPEFAIIRDGSEEAFSLGDDFICRGFTGSGDITGQVVFAGYGISMPEAGYDDYAGIDVKDKIAMVFKYNPKWKLEDAKWTPGYPRVKSATAKEHGAKGIIFISFPNDENPQEPIGSVLAGGGDYLPGFPQIHADLEAASMFFEGKGVTLSELQTKIDSLHKPNSLETAFPARIKVEAEYRKEAPTYNIAAIYEGSDPQLKDEYLVLGAHIDHVGRQGEVYFPGANDNASGSAAVLEIARAFANKRISSKRSIIFTIFSSEESGLYGASNFVKNPPVELSKITAMMNFDCVGHGDSVRVGGVSDFPKLYGIVKELDGIYTRQLANHSWRGGGADAEPFFRAGIPTLYFVTTNSYTHLHSLTDTPETLNQDLFEALTRLGFLTANEIAQGNYIKEEALVKQD